jgi:hypothetical protein
MPRFGDMAMSCVRGSFGSLHRIDDPDSCLCRVDPKATSERRRRLIAQKPQGEEASRLLERKRVEESLGRQSGLATDTAASVR